ncbi:MAG: T9SS type A sorting domain-containing protein [Bacteroidota bacterium]
MKSALTLLIVTFFLKFAFAQNPVTRCATEVLPQQFEVLLEQWKNKNTEKLGGGTVQSVFNIPVIVHIIHNNEPVNTVNATTGGNLNAAQILDQINILNKDFNGLNADTNLIPNVFKPLHGKFQINFCLAVVNPTGGILAEPGIDRINRNTSGWTAPPYSTTYVTNTIKPASIWDPNRYFNIWVCAMSGGILGYATFPNPGSSGLQGLSAPFGTTTTDGVVILNTAFGSIGTAVTNAPYHKGRTATHEVGHWIGLRHIWGDGTCASDFCNDTPPAQQANYNCPTFPYKTGVCTGNTTGEMTMNFMDYTNDLCMYMFTKDQKVRAQLIMTNSPMRASLITSTVCNMPSTQNEIGILYISNPSYSQSIPCAPSISPSVVLKNFAANTLSTATFSYNINGINTQTFAWIGALAPNSSVSVNMPSVAVPGLGQHIYNVGVYAPNGGTDPYMINNFSNQYFTMTSGNLNVSINSASICVGSSATLIANGASQYTWNTGAQSPSIIVSPTTTTQYSVLVFSNGCQASANTTVSVFNYPVALSCNSPSICSGSFATLNASGANSYSWSSGQNGAQIVINPSVSGTYTLFGTNGGVCTSSVSVFVYVEALPQISVSGPSLICIDETHTITAQGAQQYSWNAIPGGSTYIISPTSPGTISIFGSSNLGCTSTIDYSFEMSPCTDIIKTALSDIRIYPNPVIDQLKIESLNLNSIELYSIHGQNLRPPMVYFNTLSVLDLQSLPKGIYLLKLKQDQKNIFFRIIKDSFN